MPLSSLIISDEELSGGPARTRSSWFVLKVSPQVASGRDDAVAGSKSNPLRARPLAELLLNARSEDRKFCEDSGDRK